MNTENEQNFDEQPISQIMASHNLKANDLVSVSTEQLTFKMVSRACKGRLLTRNTEWFKKELISLINKRCFYVCRN